MACKEQNTILSYILGEFPDEDRERVEAHAQDCGSCAEMMGALETTDRMLRTRKSLSIPKNLATSCIRAIDEEEKRRNVSSGIQESLLGRLLTPAPAWRFAVLVIVFLGGLGAGKLLFDSPTWIDKYASLLNPSEDAQVLSEERAIRNYLLSVETLFLGLSNMESTAVLDEEEWELELEVTNEILKRTRRIKRILEDRDPELYQLVGEIEWVLEDIVGTSGWEFADLSRDVRQQIDERRLLMKIHVHI